MTKSKATTSKTGVGKKTKKKKPAPKTITSGKDSKKASPTKTAKPKSIQTKTGKSNSVKAKPSKANDTSVKNDMTTVIQSLRKRVQMQSKIIAVQKKQLVDSSHEQMALANKHSKQLLTLKQKQNARVQKIKESAQQKIDIIKAETSLKLTENKETHRKQVDELKSLKSRTLAEANKLHAKKIKQYKADRRERLKQQVQLFEQKITKLRAEQKEIIKKIKVANAEKLEQIKKTSAEKIHQANKDIANLQQAVSAFEKTDKNKTIKQLNNSRKFLEDRKMDIETLEQQLLSVQNFIDTNVSQTSPKFTFELFILKLLSVGYHRYARIHYLNLITERDWENLLKSFKNTLEGYDTLEALRPLFLPWVQYYHALIDVIHDQGYTIRPLESWTENGPKHKILYMYHDVHAWDILPALGLALANKDRDICTTFLLNIDQAHIDQSHESGYRIFGTLSDKHVRAGLHCNPFATWVRMDVFKGNEKAFMSWVKSNAAAEDLVSLLDDNQIGCGIFGEMSRKTAREGTLRQLKNCFQKLQSFIPQAVSASHHGDILNSLYCATDFKNISNSTFVHTPALLSNRIVNNYGIELSPTSIQKKNSKKIDIFSEMPNKASYFENLHKALDSGQNMLLINHPGAISNYGLTMNLDFVSNLKNSKFQNYKPVDTPFQSPSQMLVDSKNDNNVFDVED